MFPSRVREGLGEGMFQASPPHKASVRHWLKSSTT